MSECFRDAWGNACCDCPQHGPTPENFKTPTQVGFRPRWATVSQGSNAMLQSCSSLRMPKSVCSKNRGFPRRAPAVWKSARAPQHALFPAKRRSEARRKRQAAAASMVNAASSQCCLARRMLCMPCVGGRGKQLRCLPPLLAVTEPDARCCVRSRGRLSKSSSSC